MIVHDNADFNVNTINGEKTFHQMGGVKCITPPPTFHLPNFPRLSDVSSNNIQSEVQNKKIPIRHWQPLEIDLPGPNFPDLHTLKPGYCDSGRTMPSNSTVLWMLLKKKYKDSVPSWSGFMSKLMMSREYKTSKIVCMPFINLPPSSLDAIFTVLSHTADILRSPDTKMRHACLTFDLPLYAKSITMLHEILSTASPEDRAVYIKIIIRLGGFHLLMSFMGAIGNIMAGSGLEELWSTIYAPHVAKQMLSGHPYARTIRAHFLTQLSLAIILIEECSSISPEIDEQVQEIWRKFEGNNFHLTEIEQSIVAGISGSISQKLEEVRERGKTATLWIQYFHMVNLIMNFVEAERSGNWDMHLQTVHNMVPYFHAAGHLLYARYIPMYLQDMYSLNERMPPDEYHKFTTEGYFTIRRTDKFWAGLWSDLTIEQTLMRSIKSQGGLIGRSFSEKVVDHYILTAPYTYEICDSIEKFAGIYYRTSEQHVQLRSSRIKRDEKDVGVLLSWFQLHPPFPCLPDIASIYSGVVGDKTVNCYNAFVVGSAAMSETIGQDLKKLKLKRNARVVPLSSTSKVVEHEDPAVTIDTHLLFQRLILVMDSVNLKECFSHELAPFPLSIFQGQGVLQKTVKSSLYQHLKVCEEISCENCECHVIDGGFLLHRVNWPSGSTYGDVVEAYVSFVKRNYTNPVVVFDGYSSGVGSTKGVERRRRYGTSGSKEILFDMSTVVLTGRELFLSNSSNKSRLIEALKDRFSENHIGTIQADEDADLLIVQTGIERARGVNSTAGEVFIVGEDIDLLILLLYHSTNEPVKLFKPSRGKKTPSMLYCPQEIKRANSNIQQYILFLHAFSGCDTTSAFFNKGKGTIFKIIRSNSEFQQLAIDFQSGVLGIDHMLNIGNKLTAALYNKGNIPNMSLDDYRFYSFEVLVAKRKKQVQLETLPPTMAANEEHCRRVYQQICAWKGISCSPIGCGWKEVGPFLEPVMTRRAPAPAELLTLISCGCKMGCKKGCGCVKFGLKCSRICSPCAGESCHNASNPEIIIDDDCEDDELITIDGFDF